MTIQPCPKPFDFDNSKNPQGSGTVHEEVVVEDLLTKDKGYRKVVQLLEWKKGEFKGDWSIRIGYYWKPHGARNNEWKWGSQNTSIISIEYIDTLIKALVKLKEEYEKKRENIRAKKE